MLLTLLRQVVTFLLQTAFNTFSQPRIGLFFLTVFLDSRNLILFQMNTFRTVLYKLELMEILDKGLKGNIHSYSDF